MRLATWSAVSPNIPGNFTLTADDRDGVAPLYTAATSDNFVVAAASSATKLAFTTAAQAPPVGTCSTKVTVQSQLAGGGFANQPTALPLVISASNTAFYSDALCATPLSTFPTCCHVSVSGADERVAAAESLKLAMTVSVPAVAPA